ncbi:peptide chain release factor N(5)-glutamine methyltransferase [Pontibacterium granulatum]|uniref:peptide chain release factor N(5)-glutamine methyltransferase n=1 Tax=Pontibacterium granulatum TaxID=2036029 RepID=UPI00249CC06B|nr:peptide chain release factor N(5)-glutamine methyltransferase [Pontibacterium granulatum]MDI3323821.1 peptide chain release factor N(5)-glutamine methyltransferase [Pontibacterium granulatum]
MNIEQAVAQHARLQEVSDSSRLDAELLLCHVIEQPRSYLFTWSDRELSAEQVDAYKVLLQRRLLGEPVAHLIGSQAFWTLDLEVTPDTLIPRPETETLVEVALDKLAEGPYRVADLGTGTGAIALSLASERRRWHVVGCDRVDAAVQLAERNRQRLEISNAEFVQGSWFEPLQGTFDMIVSNPPYIDPEDPHLQQGDVRFEPLSALIADNQGMADIEQIADTARTFLNTGGWLLFEHGYDQGPVSRELLQRLGYTNVETIQDLGARDRVTLGCWRGSEDNAE